MKLCILISEEFGVTVKTSDIHENNTVEKLEKYVMLAPKIRTYEKREVYPLTGSQKGIFAECMKNPESTVYNIPFLFELESSVDVQKLSDAISQMIAAHPYLLTKVYLSDSGEMVQKPCEEAFVPEVVRTTNEQFEKMKDELVRPFKLEKGRLFRAGIYVTEDRKYLLQISTISWQMVIPMILFLRISIGPIWVRNWRKNPTQALMLPLMKNSR